MQNLSLRKKLVSKKLVYQKMMAVLLKNVKKYSEKSSESTASVDWWAKDNAKSIIKDV